MLKALTKDKRGVLDNVQGLVIGLIGLGIVLVIAFLIYANIAANSTVAADTNASAAVTEVTNATSDIPGWLPIIVIVFIGGILIALVAIFKQRG